MDIREVLISKLPGDLEVVIAHNIDRAIKGEISQFLYGLDMYLKVDEVAKNYYIQKGKQSIAQVIRDKKVKISDDFFNDLPEMYFAFNGALSEGILIGFDMDKEGCPRALYTRDFSLIHKLASVGCITNAENIDKAEGMVYGTKTINGLKNGKEALIGVARLDLEEVDATTKLPKFKVVVPQSPLKVGLNAPILMTPLKGMVILSSKLDVLLEKNIVRFTESTPKGIKQSVVTNNDMLVRDFYRGNDPYLVDNKVKGVKKGYDYALLRYFTHNLESSLYTKGYATFRPEMLDRVECINPNEVDTSQHRLNYINLRGVYKDKVKALSLDELFGITFYDLSTFATLEDKCKGLLEYGESLGNTELYWLMKQNEDIFGNLEEELRIKDESTPQIVKNLKPTSLAGNIDMRVEDIKDYLSKGLVKITTLTKKGKVMEVYASNNKKVLMQLLGKDFVREYETVKYKYLEIKRIIENTTFENRRSIEDLVLKYGLNIEVVVQNADDNLTNGVDGIIRGIDTELAKLSEKSSRRRVSPTMVTVRNVYANKSSDLYSMVDVSQITNIEFAPLV